MKVEIFTRDGCPFCDMAINIFNQHGVEYSETKLNNNSERQKFYNEMNQNSKVQSHVSTVPQIFINDEHIGGFSDLNRRSSDFFK